MRFIRVGGNFINAAHITGVARGTTNRNGESVPCVRVFLICDISDPSFVLTGDDMRALEQWLIDGLDPKDNLR